MLADLLVQVKYTSNFSVAMNIFVKSEHMYQGPHCNFMKGVGPYNLNFMAAAGDKRWGNNIYFQLIDVKHWVGRHFSMYLNKPYVLHDRWNAITLVVTSDYVRLYLNGMLIDYSLNTPSNGHILPKNARLINTNGNPVGNFWRDSRCYDTFYSIHDFRYYKDTEIPSKAEIMANRDFDPIPFNQRTSCPAPARAYALLDPCRRVAVCVMPPNGPIKQAYTYCGVKQEGMQVCTKVAVSVPTAQVRFENKYTPVFHVQKIAFCLQGAAPAGCSVHKQVQCYALKSDKSKSSWGCRGSSWAEGHDGTCQFQRHFSDTSGNVQSWYVTFGGFRC